MSKRPAQKAADRDRLRLTRPADFDALPKRFKLYIAALESERAAAVETAGSNTPTRVSIRSRNAMLGDEVVRYFPDNAVITFMVDPAAAERGFAGEVRVSLTARTRSGVYGVQVTGASAIRVVPCVSNAVVIEEAL